MQQLANEIVQIIRDYRNDDGIQMTSSRVLQWVRQFDPKDQLFILQELKNIFQKRYISKSRARQFLTVVIERLAQYYKYSTYDSFLNETIFLDLQKSGKSQKVMLELLDEVLQEEYSTSLADCGSLINKNYVYLDDVLCTGNTVFQDLKVWLEQIVDNGTQLHHLLTSNANVILVHIFTHKLNLDKLHWRFHYLFRNFVFRSYQGIQVDNNYNNQDSKLDFLFPIREGQSQLVMDYYKHLGNPTSGAFREQNRPKSETFFSSPENRVRFENILLNKGLQILNSVIVQKENMRPLGYTLPSQKNFGFGGLCFTWRNVPNNTPLVFWYATPTWMPLFENKR